MSARPSQPLWHRALPITLVLLATFLQTGCEQLGLDDGAKLAAAKDAEGKAIGGACRHTGRALEDCYILNTKALKASIYAGWRDMDGYMRENKIENATPSEGRAKHTEAKPVESKPVESKAEDNKPSDPTAADKAKPAKH